MARSLPGAGRTTTVRAVDILPGSDDAPHDEPDGEPRPAAPGLKVTTDDAIAAAKSALPFLGIYLAICTALFGIAFVSATSNAWDWFRGGVLIAGSGLHASIVLTVNSGSDEESFGDISSSFGVTALTATAIAVFLAIRLARRAERDDPSDGTRKAVLNGVLTGVLATAVLAIIGLIAKFDASDLDSGSSSDEGTLHLGLVSTLLFGSLVLSAAFAWGRVQVQRSTQGLPPLRTALAQRTRGLSPWIATAAQHAVLSAVLMTITGFVYGVLTSTQEVHESFGQPTESDVSGFVALLFFVPNLALAATGFFMGFSVNVGGVLGGFGEFSQSVGVFTGDLPAKGYLWILVPLFGALLVGARRATMTPSAVLLAGWWQAGLGSLIVWVPLGFLLQVQVSAGGGFGAGGYSTGFSALTLVPLAFAWGVIVMVLGRLGAGPLNKVVPGLMARVAGPVDEQEQTLTPPPGMSRRTGVILATVVAVVAAAGIGHAVVGKYVYGPKAAAQDYLDALSAGDVPKALGLLDTSEVNGPRTLLAAGALPPGKRITNAKIDKISTQGGIATVSVHYTLGEDREDGTFTLKHAGSRALLFHGWKVTGGGGTLDVNLPSTSGSVTVNGIAVSASDSGELAALPGLYDFALPDSPYLTVADNPHPVQLDSFGFSYSSSGSTELTLTDKAMADAEKAAVDYVRSCLKAATGPSTDCGVYAADYASSYSGLSWTLTTPPDVEVQYSSYDNKARISTRSSGTATFNATALDPNYSGGAPTRRPVHLTEQVSVYGYVTFDGGTATFSRS
jgi:hypothetical protein